MVVEPYKVLKGKENRWWSEFLCDCGATKEIMVYAVSSGRTETCGCKQLESAMNNLSKIGPKSGLPERKHKLYEQWKHMHSDYKGEFCKDWDDYINFYRWGIDKHKDGCLLIRIDKNINYCPDNCRFISKTDATLVYNLNTIENQSKVINTCLKRYGRFPVTGHGTSKQEIEIRDWLLSLGYEFPSTYKVISPKQLDLYNQELKLAIEYCGEYWHNSKSKSPKNSSYHYKKYKACLDQGIRLITIFGKEWKDRQAQWKNLIKSVLGIYEQRVFARKCEVRQVDKKIGKQFFEDYHIQGGRRVAKVYFGIYYGDELLGVVSLNSHHRNVANTIVLDRLCFKDGVQVVGGAGKLLKRCIDWSKDNNYTKIVSWSDNRYSQGNVYEKVGFTMEEELKPDYKYVDMLSYDSPLISKQAMKTKEKDKEFMENYGKIYDCGKKRYAINL